MSPGYYQAGKNWRPPGIMYNDAVLAFTQANVSAVQ